MEYLEIKLIEKEKIIEILPLLKELNTNTPDDVLKERLLEMITQHYECVGVYLNDELVGISGLWFLTRHYCGKTVEPDHVVIGKNHRNKGLGKKLLNGLTITHKALGMKPLN